MNATLPPTLKIAQLEQQILELKARIERLEGPRTNFSTGMQAGSLVRPMEVRDSGKLGSP